MSKIEYPLPDGLLHNPAFPQAVAASGTRTIHAARQVSIDGRGAPVGAGGTTFADVVKITTYVVDYGPEHRTVAGQARAPCFAGRTPPPGSKRRKGGNGAVQRLVRSA